MDLKLFKKGNYLYLKNGIIEDKNVRLNDLNIQEDFDLTIIHDINQSCEIELVINENIKANILEIFNLDLNSDINVKKKIVCKKNSDLNITTIEHANDGFKSHIDIITTLDDNAKINNKKLSLYLNESKESEDVLLHGKKAKYENFNVLVNTSKKVQGNDLVVTHDNIETESIMRNYAIAKGASTLNVNTNGIVKRGAKRANISQKSKGILLDIDSAISANPWLQIDEFDCLASHGAGIGAISEEELYYLMSRGLTRRESERIIIDGFVSPIYNEIKDEEEKEEIIKLVKTYL